MSSSITYEIDAEKPDGERETLKVRIADQQRDWANGAFVTLPNGRHVLIIDKGLYQAVGSGEIYRSDDPHAP